MKKLIIFAMILFSISFISSLCEEGQIDINTASAEELDEITQIGPAYAEQIIALRLFDSVDDLIRVSGIAEKRLEKIKEQGLACVSKGDSSSETIEETEEINEEYVEEVKEEIEIEEIQKPEPIYDEAIDKEKKVKLEIIKLNTKSIKRENNNENSDKNNYAAYGFVAFCILLGFLFILKKRKNYKTEFKRNEE